MPDIHSSSPHASVLFALGAAAIWTVFALIFQLGHFAEHALQFGIWLLGDLSGICGRNTAWMSPWVMSFVEKLGAQVAPTDSDVVQNIIGLEVLHLIGNSIFLSGLLTLSVFNKHKTVRWAIYIEGFHLCEHILLTATAVYLHQPIGLSTLFGKAGAIGSREFAVGYRVSWHFVMNLMPLPFAMMGIWAERYKLSFSRGWKEVLTSKFSYSPANH